MQVEIINPMAEHQAWNEFVENHSLASFYHQAGWAGVIEQTFSHTQACYFVLKNRQNQLEAALPLFLVKSRLLGNRLVSLPFTPNCDPLVETARQWEQLMDAVLIYQQEVQAKYLELRAFFSPAEIYDHKLNQNRDYATFELTLDQPPEKLRQKFHKGCVLRSLKKAEKNGVQLRWGSSEADLRAFCDLLILTRRKHGFPPQPFEFYENMWKAFYPKNQIALPLAVYQGKIVAGIILFKYRRRVHYEFVASDLDYLNVRPNHFLIWQSLKAAWDGGFNIFDFGKTPLDNPGLVQFKERWGAAARPLTYRFYSAEKSTTAANDRRSGFQLVKRFFKSAPLPLTKLTGRLVYQHLG